MSSIESRRKFIATGAVAGAGFISGAALAQEGSGQKDLGSGSRTKDEPQQPLQQPHSTPDPTPAPDQGGYPRLQPGVGGPVGSATDRGKLVAGLRDPQLGPVPIHAPDLEKLEGKTVDGVKEFHLTAETVRREILPGVWMNTYGYNGGMPGPTIEIQQGDRLRIIVHNKLPEATSMHWHGLEVPIAMDGVPHLVQNLIEPGETFVYEFTIHQEGTFFYHSHVGMQEAMGMVGLLIVHPAKPHLPVVDKDFCLVAQEFALRPNSSVPDTLAMEWNYLTFNGRCGPYTTPLVCQLGERIRIRFINFSVMDHHPLHLHGYTFWVTGSEGGRLPEPAWVPSNNVLVGVAQAREIEFIANNPGDWILHCHMFHHMMNSMTSQAGPIIRELGDPRQARVPGYPQNMLGMGMDMSPRRADTNGRPSAYAMDMSSMSLIESRREAAGMRAGWSMGVEGLSTVVRVLPPPLYHQLMHTNDPIPPNTSTPWGPDSAAPMHPMHHGEMKSGK